MKREYHTTDVLIIGAGPAGIAAACCAAQSSAQVTIVDDNPSPGGQIWRGEARQASSSEAATWFARLHHADVQILSSARVFAQPEPCVLLAETPAGQCQLRFEKLILATGARERFLPFPGWTLPNVLGAGGLQALVKSGVSVKGKRIVIAGSGPLLLAVAASLHNHGAEIMLIAEQAPWHRLLRFAFHLARQPQKALQAFELKSQLACIPFLTGCWPIAARGKEKLTQVTLRRGWRTWEVECDYLACGFHLIPATELAELLGSETADGCVKVDEYQQTSVRDVFCAGESTGIGGLDVSLLEGQIAGFAATGHHAAAQALFAARASAQTFADLLNQTFALRDELKTLAQPGTILCRCEDVTFDRLQHQPSWREAKLQTRCGMGPCQGRICGGATEFLFGWRAESVRPPAFPCRIDSLASAGNE